MELWSSSPPYSVSDTQTAFRRFIGGYVSSVQPSPGLFSSMRILPRFQIVSRQLEGIIPTSAAAQRSRGAFRLRLIAGRRILPSAVSLLEVVAPEASPNRASKVSSAFFITGYDSGHVVPTARRGDVPFAIGCLHRFRRRHGLLWMVDTRRCDNKAMGANQGKGGRRLRFWL